MTRHDWYAVRTVQGNDPNLEFTDDVELALDEADRAAALSETRYSGKEVFSRVRGRVLYSRRDLKKFI